MTRSEERRVGKVREYEKENLADQHPEIVYEMQNILRRVRK